MAIDTYSKLQSDISDEINRTDLIADVTEFGGGTIEGAIKRAIANAEKRILRRLKTTPFEASTTLTTTSSVETVNIPADFKSVKTAFLNTSPITTLAKKDLSQLYADDLSQTLGKPNSYAAFGTKFYLRPMPDNTYSMKLFYSQSVDPLSSSVSSNAILVNYPDLLKYGALVELSPYVRDDERIQIWKGFFDEAIKDITDDNVSARWSGAPVVSNAIGVRIV